MANPTRSPSWLATWVRSQNCHIRAKLLDLERPEALLKYRVFFVCATNGLYSSMAEAMLRWLDSEHFEARSAGTICRELHPMAGQVVKEIGIDLGQTTPKSVQQLPDEEFDYIITLGERAPSYGWIFASAQIIHWKFDNAGAPDDANKQLRRFRMLRDQIVQRLRLWNRLFSILSPSRSLEVRKSE
jgi:ArsR family transcriptional regulator